MPVHPVTVEPFDLFGALLGKELHPHPIGDRVVGLKLLDLARELGSGRSEKLEERLVVRAVVVVLAEVALVRGFGLIDNALERDEPDELVFGAARFFQLLNPLISSYLAVYGSNP